MHLPPLIYDLALILIVAGGVSVLFKIIGQPTVLGYLIAGLLVGPQVKFFPTVADPENIKTWAELGVIFLLFVLGLEFSFKKLFQVGRPAVITATVEVVVMVGLGYFTGYFLGWSTTDSIFLGGILAISSTTIIVKAFEELGIKTQLFAGRVFGILIIEDLFAVVILALLASLSASQSFQGPQLALQMAKLIGFLAVFIPLGLWVTPRFLKLIHRFLNDEARVVLSIGLCLGTVLLVNVVGFTSALGAFIAGAFISETRDGEKIERFLKPVRDLFGAVFFVSVGMLVDVGSLAENWGVILLITVVTVGGKFGSTFLGMIMSRQDTRTAVQAGLSLAQIGEFSFIIATLGLSLGVLRPEVYPITVAVSVLTTFTTPYMIRAGLRLSGKKRRKKSSSPRLWDGHLVELEVHPDFKGVGQTLEELKIREKFGVSIVSIARGEQKILAPDRRQSIMPHDHLVVFGDEAQLEAFESFLKSQRFKVSDELETVFGLRRIELSPRSKWVGMSLHESGIREGLSGLVLGVERGSERILNPDSKSKLAVGDVLWIYCSLEKARAFNFTGPGQS